MTTLFLTCSICLYQTALRNIVEDNVSYLILLLERRRSYTRKVMAIYMISHPHLLFFSKIFFYAYSYWRTSAFFFLILMFSLGSFRGAVCLDQTLLLPSSSSISIIGLVSGPCITIPTTEGLSLSSCCSNNPAALANTLSTATLSCSSTSN